MKRLQSLWRQISYFGVTEGTPLLEKSRILLVNRLCLATIVLSIPYCLPSVNPEIWHIVVLLAILNVGMLVLSSRGYTHITRWLFIFISATIVFFFAYFTNYFVGEYLMFPLVLAICPLLIDFSKWQNVLISIATVMTFYVIIEMRILSDLESIGEPMVSDVLRFRSNLLLLMVGIFVISHSYFRITNKQQKELLKAKEEAESSLKAKTQFLSIMSHEIRTPLNTVIGLSNVLQHKGLDEEEKENIDLIHFSANNLLAIINDMLDWSKIDSGNMELERVGVDLPALLNHVIASGQVLAEKKHIAFKSKIDDRIPQWLKTDSTRLTQVLNNLVSNAIKFTDKGHVLLSADMIDETDESVFIDFVISDTGIGMSAQQQAHIFESFKQADLTTTRKYGGTGLGLSIAERMVELMGSEILVSSALDKGSTFGFTLEFPRSEPGGKGRSTENTKLLKDKSVLIVDDNQLNILVAEKFLSNWSMNHDKAYNGIEAVDKVTKNSYDLILMDLSMPEMDGFESTREIRRMGYNKIPIIALTASALLDDKERIYRSGMNDYLNKPFDPLHLYEKLVHHLS